MLNIVIIYAHYKTIWQQSIDSVQLRFICKVVGSFTHTEWEDFMREKQFHYIVFVILPAEWWQYSSMSTTKAPSSLRVFSNWTLFCTATFLDKLHTKLSIIKCSNLDAWPITIIQSKCPVNGGYARPLQQKSNAMLRPDIKRSLLCLRICTRRTRISQSDVDKCKLCRQKSKVLS